MASPLVVLQDILVRYDEGPVLDVPFLEVQAREILAIIGPNGAGKSTLLRIIGLLQRPSRGVIRLHGEDVTPERALSLRRRMASVFQTPLLLDVSVYDNVALGLKLRGVDRRSTRRCVAYWLDRLGIAHLRDRPAQGLSGGEAQRTSLARALTLKPEVLLLDEPFAALDPPSRETLLLDLEAILRETGATTVFVTHDRHEALTLGDRVMVLFGGKVVQQGAPWQVFSQPATEAVARFVGAEINLPGIVETAGAGTVVLRTPAGLVEAAEELPPGTRVTLCLRPEDLTLYVADQSPPASSARNLLNGTIVKITPWGVQARVTLDCGVPLTSLVTRRSVDELGIKPGHAVLVSFKASAIHLIQHHGGESPTRSGPFLP